MTVEATPGGPGEHLIDVHDHFRRELRQLRALVDRVREGATDVSQARGQVNAMALKARDWTLGSHCLAYCLGVTQHHTLEDTVMFEHLRRAEPALGEVIDRLAAEHVDIHHRLTVVDVALVHLANHPGDHGPLAGAVDDLGTTLLAHLGDEEAALIGPLDRHGMFPTAD